MNFEQPSQSGTGPEGLKVVGSINLESGQKSDEKGSAAEKIASLLSADSPEYTVVEYQLQRIMEIQNPGQLQKQTEAAVRAMTQYEPYMKLRAAGYLYLLARLAGDGESQLEEKAATLAKPTAGDLVTYFPKHAMDILEIEFEGDVDAAINALEDYEGADSAAVKNVLSKLRDPEFEF